MNRLTVAILVLTGALFVSVLPAHGGGARAAAPAPTPAVSAPPSPTVVVPLIDISVGATPTPTPTPSPMPEASASEQIAPTESPTPAPTPHRRRVSDQKASPTPVPSATGSPQVDATPEIVRERQLDTSAAPTTIPTQPPTPRPIAASQPSIPDSLDDPNVQSILNHPIAQLSQFAWMMGTWRAHGVEEHGNGTQRDIGKNTYVFATTMKGRWIFGGDGRSSDYFYLTFDPFARHFVLVRINQNPAYGIWISAAGWHQNRIEFDSTYSWVNGRQYRRRVTIIHTDARQFGIYDEEQLPSGEWQADDAVELTKQS